MRTSDSVSLFEKAGLIKYKIVKEDDTKSVLQVKDVTKILWSG